MYKKSDVLLKKEEYTENAVVRTKVRFVNKGEDAEIRVITQHNKIFFCIHPDVYVFRKYLNINDMIKLSDAIDGLTYEPMRKSISLTFYGLMEPVKNIRILHEYTNQEYIEFQLFDEDNYGVRFFVHVEELLEFKKAIDMCID